MAFGAEKNTAETCTSVRVRYACLPFAFELLEETESKEGPIVVVVTPLIAKNS